MEAGREGSTDTSGLGGSDVAEPDAPDQSDDPLEHVPRLFHAAAVVAGGIACLTSLLVLLGWTADVEALRKAGMRSPAVTPLAAASLLTLGLALTLLAGRPGPWLGRAGRSLAFLAAAAGLLTVIEYVLAVRTGIDLLPFPEAVAQAGLPDSGRVPPASAVAILLLGGSLVVYDLASVTVHRVAEFVVLLVTVIALEALFGYAFGMEAPYGLSGFPAMPLQTAVALLALTVGTALLRTHRGGLRILADPGAAGVALRRLIPVCVAGPFLIGWLTFFGVTTEFFSTASGLTFSVSLMCVLLLLAVGWTTRELNRIDRERVGLLRSEREARDAAEEANRAKSEFLGVMSHELRTPLNSVISYADILDAGIKGPLNDDQLHYVKRIRISGAHLRSMIEELLQFTSAQKGAVTLEIRPVDAAELAREALAVVAHEVDTGTVEVHHQLPDEPLEIHTDPDKVLHVLVNLLANALKFTKRGRVGLRVLEESRSVVFEVWDTGPGIPKEHRERIFQEFTQLETDGDGRKGTGLGLAIGRAYADLLDGRLEVDSWVGRGSVFRLVLPNDGARAS